MFLWLIHQGILVEVHLEFMVPGHSFMPCDRSFGVLEKKYRRRGIINAPPEYVAIIEGTENSTSTNLGHDQILDFKSLLEFIQFRKASTVLFSKSTRIILRLEHPWHMLLVTPTGSEYVNLNKANNQFADPEDEKNLLELTEDKYKEGLPIKYHHRKQLKITDSKVNHLKAMKPYLSKAGRDWVDSVITGQLTAKDRPRTANPDPDGDPDVPPEEDPDNNDDDEYTPIPEPEFPPGYLRGDPPPNSHAKRKLATYPAAANKRQRKE